jgi:hypothetical protein
MQKLSDNERIKLSQCILHMINNPRLPPDQLPGLVLLLDKISGTDTVVWYEKGSSNDDSTS